MTVAIVLWNIVYLERATQAQGEVGTPFGGGLAAIPLATGVGAH